MNELLESLQIDRQEGTPAKAAARSRRARNWRALLVVAAGVAAAAATLSGYVVATRPVLVDTFTVAASPDGPIAATVLTAGGYVRDPKVVYVAPKVSGRIASLAVREGDVVHAGDVVALIDSRDLDQETAEARANYELAAANLRKLRAGSRPEEIAESRARFRASALAQERAEREFQRSRALFDAGIISAQALDQAETEVKAGASSLEAVRQSLLRVESGPRKEEVETAQAAVEAAQARLATASNRSRYARVEAPVAGRVLRKFRNVGDFVSPEVPFMEGYETVAVGSPVVSLAAVGDQEVAADINETEIAKIALGQRVEIAPGAYPQEVFHGSVTQVSPRADRNKNTVEVKVTIEGAARVLPYDLSVKMSFLGAPAPTAVRTIRIPASAIVQRGGGRYVFLAAGSRASRRVVEAGAPEGEMVVVSRGISDGDRVIVSRTDTIEDGAPIRVR